MAHALTDIAWVKTNIGVLTPREVFLRAHNANLDLDQSLPAYEITTQFRFLLSVTALAVRHEIANGRVTLYRPEKLLTEGLSSAAVDAAIADLGTAADVFDSKMPFMQRPALAPTSAKDASRRIGRANLEVKKLSPSMPSAQGEDYWNLIVAFPGELPLGEAVLKLVTYHYYSMAGNNNYDGDKTRMGAPGIRFLGKGNAATEFIWRYEDHSLLGSLLAALPQSWVEGAGLPAWADRQLRTSRLKSGGIHPLWVSTWSSNTAVGFWESKDGEMVLTGVRVGGVPPEWFPFAVTNKEGETQLKEFWDARNQHDPMYLHIPNKDGELKVQRIDFGRDGADLAVEWAKEGKIAALIQAGSGNVYPYGGETRTPVFYRHQIEGTASSPTIRASEVFVPDPQLWGFDLDYEDQVHISEEAAFVWSIYKTITSCFRRKNKKMRNA
ncbi:type I-E CRISPR-associated protein Cse1/CasA [Arcanobacterium hippocoleae]